MKALWRGILGTFLVMVMGVMPLEAQADVPIEVIVYGQQLTFDVAPMIVEGRVLVPMRPIFEALNTTVRWDEATKTATAESESLMGLAVTLDEPVAMKYFLNYSNYDFETQSGEVLKENFTQLSMDVPATLVDGRVMVPLRFVSEHMAHDVVWDANNRLVTIGEPWPEAEEVFEDVSSPTIAYDGADIRNHLPHGVMLSDIAEYKRHCIRESQSYFDAQKNADYFENSMQMFRGIVDYREGNIIVVRNYSRQYFAVGLPDGMESILVGQFVTVYGTLAGTVTYQWESIPCMNADYVDGIWNQGEFDQTKGDFAAELEELYDNWTESNMTLYPYGGTMTVTEQMFDEREYVITAGEKRRDYNGEEFLLLHMNIGNEAPIQAYEMRFYYLSDYFIIGRLEGQKVNPYSEQFYVRHF